MTFNSWEFLLFYPIVLALYLVFPKKLKWPLLLIASYFFYMCYQASLVVLILLTTLVSWGAALMMDRSESVAVRRACLAVTLAVSLGVLFFFKYFNFLSGSFASLAAFFGAEVSPIVLDLVLPVGISFYTFQTLSYVIDVYRKTVPAEKNFFFYALFVSFFPQLVAGPIERPDKLMPQLKEAPKTTAEDLKVGLLVMLLGFFKKIAVADIIAPVVNSVYNSPTEAGAVSIIVATLLFSVQIYCDFSGYTDIATGCARIMGIRLMKNFDRPYSAVSIKDFWSRWHISLSGWLRDYLYIPLGGNRAGKFRHLLNLFIVFLASGLWHGASWTFVLWGAIHGVYQIFSALTFKKRNELLSRIGADPESKVISSIRRVATFIAVTFAWLIFRANSIADVGILLGNLGKFDTGIAESFEFMGLDLLSSLLIVFSVISLIFLDKLIGYETRSEDRGAKSLSRSGGYIYYVWAIIAAWALLLSRDMISTFIYFQF